MKKIIVFAVSLMLAGSALAQSTTTVSTTTSVVRPDFVGRCLELKRNLRLGLTGSDVEELQKFLEGQGVYHHPQGVAYGYFGRLTMSGVTRFQEMHANEVLNPHGLIRGTGFVGSSTIAKIRGIGCGPINRGAPVISLVSGPTTLKVDEEGTWTIKASDPENGNLSYSVVWDDEARPSGQPTNVPRPEARFVQTATFSHSYENTGTYRPTFTVRDDEGKTSRVSLTVRVGSVPEAAVRVLSPNGGEKWNIGQTRKITWSSNSPVDIKIEQYFACLYSNPACALAQPAPRVIGWQASGGSYSWKVGNVQDPREDQIFVNTLSGGEYKILVCLSGTNTCDSSDRPFSVVSSTACFVGGCSSQICSDDPNVVSTCEWRPQYACYRTAKCERQTNGQCGWTPTSELVACLANPPQN